MMAKSVKLDYHTLLVKASKKLIAEIKLESITGEVLPESRSRLRLYCQDEDSEVKRLIKEEDILQDVKAKDGSSKKCKKLLILGCMGVGKTSVLIRLVKHEDLRDKITIFLKSSELCRTKEILPADALLVNFFSDRSDTNRAFEWIKANSAETVLVIDSVDDLPLDLTKEPKSIDCEKKSTLTDIVHNLLSGKLLPEATVIASSRNLGELHSSVQPDRYIHVHGLKSESVEDILGEILGEERGMEVKKILQEDFAELRQMIKNPLFLCATAIAYKIENATDRKASTTDNAPDANASEDENAPDTVAGIMANYIIQCARSKHISNDIPYIKKLIPKCLDEIRKGTALSTLKGLPELKNTEGLFAGVHVSYFLAVFAIIRKTMEEFGSIVPRELEEEDLQKHLYGVIFNEKVFSTACEALEISTEIPDIEEKKEVLRNHLQKSVYNALKDRNKQELLLKVFKLLREGKDGLNDLIRETTRRKSIDFEGELLSPGAAGAIGAVIRHAGDLESLNLTSCGLDEGKMKKLTENTKRGPLTIGRVNVSNNPGMGEGGMEHFGDLVKHCKASEVHMNSCNLKPECLRRFHKKCGDMKYAKIVATDNKDIGFGVRYLGALMEDAGHLDLSQCRPDYSHVRSLRKVFAEKNRKVDELKLGDSWSRPEYDASLLELLQHVEKRLDLSGWKIDERQMTEILQARKQTPQLEIWNEGIPGAISHSGFPSSSEKKSNAETRQQRISNHLKGATINAVTVNFGEMKSTSHNAQSEVRVSTPNKGQEHKSSEKE